MMPPKLTLEHGRRLDQFETGLTLDLHRIAPDLADHDPEEDPQDRRQQGDPEIRQQILDQPVVLDGRHLIQRHSQAGQGVKKAKVVDIVGDDIFPDLGDLDAQADHDVADHACRDAKTDHPLLRIVDLENDDEAGAQGEGSREQELVGHGGDLVLERTTRRGRAVGHPNILTILDMLAPSSAKKSVQNAI